VKIKPPKAGSNKARRRPRFYDDELDLLLTNATEQCVMSSGRTAHCRMMLWAFIELMLGTGIRVSEAYWLQAKHLEFRPISDIRQAQYDNAPETWEDDGLVGFKYSALPTQDGKLMSFRVRVAPDNPGLKDVDHARLVIPTYYYSEVLYQHLAYLAGHIEKITGQIVEDPLELPPEQFLFVNYDGSRTKSFRNGFESLLDSSKSNKYPRGLRMRDGKTRPLTSLRHTYASKQIEAGATANGLGFLADNMGTSTEMLRKHYAQVLNELKADDLQKY
jgi:integrase